MSTHGHLCEAGVCHCPACFEALRTRHQWFLLAYWGRLFEMAPKKFQKTLDTSEGLPHSPC